ncbi:endo-alpha-N-acetylgalactosaminidase family protein [Paenibacillus glycanilyticus]|uniref:Endo-alpha-N-acetylgalactosaminidase domain-containing protein n=1 Tax=Paenibacillus glycanilyticus TaxID=126569 RepID=A0ABQ6GDW5_9BACL|nr:endo-alpha-N-acetylgalactosaminidase family protein [Paenibacillus glycanilyticus]GLX68438.1 hypothetical protein MU1_27830 [Paenibacillus glycanilyticus]
MGETLDRIGIGVRGAPSEPLFIQSDELEILLDNRDGLPYSYRMKLQEETFWGEPYGSPIQATLCRLQPRRYATMEVSVARSEAHESKVDFYFNASMEGKLAATFAIRYCLQGATVTVTLEDVKEQPGYELIDLSIPGLVSIRETDGHSWLAHGNEGGNLVSLHEAKSGTLPENSYFGKVLATLPVVMAGKEKGACTLEVQSFLDGTLLSVEEQKQQRTALLGTVKTYRVNGSLSYNMNDGGERISGNDQTPNLLADQPSVCRLDFVGDYDGNGEVDWLDGAKSVRDRMPRRPTDFYNDKLLYLIGCDNPTYDRPRTTFAECEELIRNISMLTDNAPQIAYLAGFQYEGHDTGYPAVDKVNERLGGHEGFLRLQRNALERNCLVSLDDNYDDAYMTSPQWDEAYIARRPDGQLWSSRKWSRDMSYIIGLAKYMKGPGPERIRFTSEFYNLQQTVLVDVLSWFGIRNDWDPEHPASGVKNFMEGRSKVFDEYAKYGINVVSEQLRYPWVGKMSLSVDGVHGSPCPFGGKAIPMLPLIYRHSVVYGGESGPAPKDPASILFYNSRPGPWFGADSSYGDITDFYYLNLIPWMKLHDLDIETFSRNGELASIGLSGGAGILIDEELHQHEAIYNGATILQNWSLTCPLDDNRIVFYSREEKELNYPLPPGARVVDVQALYSGHRETAAYAIIDNRILIQVPAQRPIFVYID